MVLVLTFTADGYLANVGSVPGFPTEAEGCFSAEDTVALQNWFQRVRLELATIRVKRFALLQHQLMINDFPRYYQDMLQHPEGCSNEEHAFAQRELDRWSVEGLFELSLHDDYDVWINDSGQIQAT
jgi:hypothetical protein